MTRLPLLAPAAAGGGGAIIDRASAGDLMELAVDAGDVRAQFGVLLMLGSGAPAVAVARALAERVAGVPRLRQVLRRVPLGCGRPVWVDDASFRAARHIRLIPATEPTDEGLLRVAAAAVAEPLPYARPLWRAAVCEDRHGAAVGVVIVVHHVMADGIGGLSFLARLVDGAPHAADHGPFPRARPSRAELAGDAARTRAAALRRAPAVLAGLPSAVAGVRAGLPARTASRTRRPPVSGGLRTAAAHVALADLGAAAKREGATINDAVLTVVAGAMHGVLGAGGELRASVPVALPRTTGDAGNRVGTMLLPLPTAGAPADRLRAVAGLTAARKPTARSGPGRAAVHLFGALAAVGLLRPFIARQTMVDTFISNVPGPVEPVSIAGAPVARIVPVSAVAGNVPTSFIALSYAGGLTISISADPALLADVRPVAHRLAQGCAALIGP